MDYDSKTHDIGILRQDGTTTVGLMLAQKNGVPQYQVWKDEYLAQQQFTGVPGYGALPPEKEIAIRQEDSRSGFGQLSYDSSDPKRYRKTKNCDARFKEMVIASNTANTATKPSTPTTPTIVNADFELDSDWTGTYGSRTDVTKHGGTYSWRLYQSGGQPTVYQDLTWSNTYRGLKFTFTCWVYGAQLKSRIGINDGVSTTWSSVNENMNEWEQLSVEKTLSPHATQLRLQLNQTQDGITSYFDDAAISVTSITVGVSRAGIDFNGEHYCSFGTLLCKLNGSGTAFTLVSDLGETITDLEVFGDYLAIALGSTAAKYYYMDTDETLTQSSEDDGYAEFFCAVGTTLWKAVLENELKSTTDITSSWSTATTVDSTTYNITDLITDGASLYIMKEDRSFYLDSDGAVHVLVEDTKTMVASTSGANSTVWMGNVYMPYGSAGLVEYASGVTTWRSPSKLCNDDSDYDDRIFAVVGDEEWLFAAVDNGTKVELLAGRLETIDNSTVWVWHPINQITLTGVQRMYVSTVVNKRLWISSTASGDDIYYIKLFASYGNVTADDNRDFQSDGEYETPWLHGNFKGDNKAFTKLTLDMEDTSANVYVEAYYKKLGDTSWTDIGDFKTSPRTTMYLPDDSGNNHPVSTMMKLKFVIKTNSTSSTPKLKGYDLRGYLRPTRRNIIACTVRCADNLVPKIGGVDKTLASTIKATLEEAVNATWPVTIWDIDGEEKTVIILPVKPLSYPVKTESGRNKEFHYNLLMQEVALE